MVNDCDIAIEPRDNHLPPTEKNPVACFACHVWAGFLIEKSRGSRSSPPLGPSAVGWGP